jgi:hypothetical protein
LRVKLQQLHVQKQQVETEKAALENKCAECVRPLPARRCALWSAVALRRLSSTRAS